MSDEFAWLLSADARTLQTMSQRGETAIIAGRLRKQARHYRANRPVDRQMQLIHRPNHRTANVLPFDATLPTVAPAA